MCTGWRLQCELQRRAANGGERTTAPHRAWALTFDIVARGPHSNTPTRHSSSSNGQCDNFQHAPDETPTVYTPRGLPMEHGGHAIPTPCRAVCTPSPAQPHISRTSSARAPHCEAPHGFQGGRLELTCLMWLTCLTQLDLRPPWPSGRAASCTGRTFGPRAM